MFRPSLILIVLPLAFAAAACGRQGGTPRLDHAKATAAWPMAGGNAQRNGRSTLAGPVLPAQGQPAPDMWTYHDEPTDQLGGFTVMLLSPPVMDSQGNSYFTTLERFVALDPRGNERWAKRIFEDLDGDLGSSASPVICSDGSVVFSSREGKVWSFGADGSQRWTLDLRHEGIQLVTQGDRLYAQHDQSLSAYDLGGSKLWDFDSGGPLGYSTAPALSPDGTALIYAYNGNYIAVSAQGGELWRYDSGLQDSDAVDYPVFDGAHWLVPDIDSLAALSTSGELDWYFPNPAGAEDGVYYGAPAIGADGSIYLPVKHAPPGAPTLYALNSSGAAQWQITPSGGQFASGTYCGSLLVDAKGKVYTTQNNSLLAFDGSSTSSSALNLQDAGAHTTLAHIAVGGQGLLLSAFHAEVVSAVGNQ